MRATSEIGLAVTAAEVRRARHFGDAADDPLLEAYSVAAQEVVETACRRPLLPRDVIIETRKAGGQCWWFPVAPVQSLASIEMQGPDGAWSDLGLDGVVLSSAFDEPKIKFPNGYLDGVTDGGAIRVTASVGYQLGELRKGMCQAIIMMVKEWYDAGIAVEHMTEIRVSFGVERLIKQNRYNRPNEWGWT